MASLFLDTLKGIKRERPPVWFMRQAGRCLANYNKLRETYSFMELMETPSLAADVTLMPVRELGVDAAILFSDILVIPQALGMSLTFTSDGPRFETALKDIAQPAKALKPNPERLNHVYEAITEIIKQKPADIPLIGFCGGPLTVMCYMVQGLGTNHEFPDAVSMFQKNKEKAHAILNMITDMSIHYALEQVKHGIQAFQLFETWAGLIPSSLYFSDIMPYVDKIINAVRSKSIPVIFYPRLMDEDIFNVTADVTDALSIDTNKSLTHIRDNIDPDIVLQGNFDPELLLKDWATIEEHLAEFGAYGRKDHKWIFNLGHGVLPTTDSANLAKLVQWVKAYNWQR